MDILEAYFEILSHFPGYERRKVQETMVGGVWDAFDNKRSLVVEAGTGSGKSFGYLIPAILQSSRPIVISTGTIALQEQLLFKDLPFLGESPGLRDLVENGEITVKLVKGRRNYVCIQKMLELERELEATSPQMRYLDFMKAELDGGWDGDRGNLDFAVAPDIWEEIQSDSDDCLGRRCRFYQENPYRLAREDLAKADIIIANHALYLQDLVAGQSLLPAHDVVIFDEAHNLKRYALNAFTGRIGKFATTKLLQKIRRRLKAVPEEYMVRLSQSEARVLHWLFQRFSSHSRGSFRLVPDPQFLEAVGIHVEILKEIHQWLTGINVNQLQLIESKLEADKLSVQKDKLMQQLEGLMTRWEFFMYEDPFAHDRVNWVEMDREKLYFELKSTPLNIAEMLGNSLWPEKTAILASATLAVNGSLDFCKLDLGLTDKADDLILESPFDYSRQCTLYIPDNMPDPNSFQFVIATAEQVEAILYRTDGRAFVLFTSGENMRRVADALIPRLPYPCKVQGELPRNRLIEWFKNEPNSVLFATATFWEGIDIPGESLSCVIMDKIPFSPPDDPVNQATIEYLKAQGRDWFADYVLPQATLRMKQGFGRLIRTHTDHGLVAILDPRIRTKGYGRRILRSLPDVRVIHDLDDYVLENLPEEAVY